MVRLLKKFTVVKAGRCRDEGRPRTEVPCGVDRRKDWRRPRLQNTPGWQTFGGATHPMGLRFHTPIIAGHSAEYCRSSATACSMPAKTPCIRACVVTPNSTALDKRLRHRA